MPKDFAAASARAGVATRPLRAALRAVGGFASRAVIWITLALFAGAGALGYLFGLPGLVMGALGMTGFTLLGLVLITRG